MPGEVEEAAGDPEGADLHLREAVVAADTAGDDETLLELRRDLPGERWDLAYARFLFAQALWNSGAERTRATAAAAQASDGFAKGKGDGRWRADVDRSRASHGGL